MRNMWYVSRMDTLFYVAPNTNVIGKYWHRHRKPMVVEYNSTAEFHLNKIREAELARTMARRKGGAAALRAQNISASTPGADEAEPPSSPPPPESVPETPARQVLPEIKRAVSPASSTSSDSEPPLAQRITRMNGSNHASSVPPASTSSAPPVSHQPPPVSHPAPPSSGAPASPAVAPQWLYNATQAMRAKYPDDLFILKRINGTEWRIKCSDCPGKVRDCLTRGKCPFSNLLFDSYIPPVLVTLCPITRCI